MIAFTKARFASGVALDCTKSSCASISIVYTQKQETHTANKISFIHVIVSAGNLAISRVNQRQCGVECRRCDLQTITRGTSIYIKIELTATNNLRHTTLPLPVNIECEVSLSSNSRNISAFSSGNESLGWLISIIIRGRGL